ncbi:MAG: hypothetical protein WC556_14570 [Candidatus Methanoperedens sp.]
MKKSIVLLLILVVLGFSGCLQKTGENTAATNNATVTPVTGDNITASNTVPASPLTGNNTISTEAISSDIESISKEVAGIDTNVSENTITPLTESDLAID